MARGVCEIAVTGCRAWAILLMSLCGVAVPTLVSAQAARPSAASGQSTQRASNIEAGRQLFQKTCVLCHGEAGIGNRAPALRGSKFTVAFVRDTVTTGRAGTVMPKFGGVFSPLQISQLAQYVSSLQQGDATWAALRGDASNGESIFFDPSQAHSCSVCHSLKGTGSKVGPDLGPVVSRLSPREIFQRIVIVPHRSADPSYVNLMITMQSGEQLRGIRAEESTDAINFYETSVLPPTLRSIAKADILSMKKLDGSAMPSDYASRFSLKQLLDLVTFLRVSTTKGAAAVTMDDLIIDSSRR